VTVRLPGPVVDYIDAHMTEQIHNRSEFLQHWAMVGMKVSENAEIAEGLAWALGLSDVSVPPQHVRPYERPEIPMAEPDPQPVVETPAPGDPDFDWSQVGGVIDRPPDPTQQVYEDMLTQFRSKVR